MKEHVLESRLNRFVELLATYNEEHWHAYFREAQILLSQNRIEQAKRKIRKAYGGMGSIADSLYFNGAPKEIAEEGYSIRSDLYVVSESEGLFTKILKYLKNKNEPNQ